MFSKITYVELTLIRIFSPCADHQIGGTIAQILIQSVRHSSQHFYLRWKSIARILAALFMTLALLSGSSRFITFSASSPLLCQMECCRALFPHASGACHLHKFAKRDEDKESDTSCRSGANSKEERVVAAHHHRGSAAPHTTHSAAMSLNEDAGNNHRHKTGSQASHSSTQSNQSKEAANFFIDKSLGASCPPECSTGVLSFAQARSSRDTAVLAYAAIPRPPTPAGQSSYTQSFVFIPSEKRVHFSPRGPPTFLSTQI